MFSVVTGFVLYETQVNDNWKILKNNNNLTTTKGVPKGSKRVRIALTTFLQSACSNDSRRHLGKITITFINSCFN